MTEKEGYWILSKPYIRTKEVAALLECDVKSASRLLTKHDVRKLYRGTYLTADFIKKFGLSDYLKRVSRFADTQ